MSTEINDPESKIKALEAQLEAVNAIVVELQARQSQIGGVKAKDIQDMTGGEINIAGKDLVQSSTVIYVGSDTVQVNETERNKAQKAKQTYWHYLEHLRRRCQTLPLAALGGEDGTGEEISLDSVYIDLDTTTQVQVEEQIQQTLSNEGKNTHPLAVLNAAIQSPRLVLLGDPGAGKSTFVHKLLAWQAAAILDSSIQPPPGFSGQLIPVLILLRDLARHLDALELSGLSHEQQQVAFVGAIQAHLLNELELYQAEDAVEHLLQAFHSGVCLLALDGLDEVPQDSRYRVRQAVSALLHIYRPQRVIVTCRTRSYTGVAKLSGFDVYTLAPMGNNKIRFFAKAWYITQYKLGRMKNMYESEQRAASLAEAALGPDLRDLASNPMMLTSMAIIHQKEIGLPRERVRLYDLVVDVLVNRWQKRKVGERALVPSTELAAFFHDNLRLRATLERLAYEAHRAKRTGKDAADLSRGQTLALLEHPTYLGEPGLASEFLDYVDQRAGLLVGRGGDLGHPTSYSFPHRTFQEYLAGCHLADQRDLVRTLYTHAKEGDYWDLVIQMGFEEMYYNRRTAAHSLLDLAYQLCPTDLPDSPVAHRGMLWSGLIAAMIGYGRIAQDEGGPIDGKKYLERIRSHLFCLLSSKHLTVIERIRVGRTLGKIGDPRQTVINSDEMEFCWVPGGSFVMGDQKNRKPDIQSKKDLQYKISLPGYWISRYPVTQAQFAQFAQNGGYQDIRYWTEAAQAGHWQDGQVIRRIWTNKSSREERANQPYDFGEPFNLPNHPVVGITWYEALAFTRWLMQSWHARGWLATDWEIRLPTEVEWEKTARGGEKIPNQPLIRLAKNGLSEVEQELDLKENPITERHYPWGNNSSTEKANTFETGIGTTSALGCFSFGASSYGVEDLSGNIWEWTCSPWTDYPYLEYLQERTHNEQLSSGIGRVVRGGSFSDNRRTARCTARNRDNPVNWFENYGFRVVCSFVEKRH